MRMESVGPSPITTWLDTASAVHPRQVHALHGKYITYRERSK